MLTSPAPCPTPIGCLTPEPCSEVLDAQCIIYTGDDIICNTDTVVSSDDSVALALNNIVDYLCTEIENIPVVIVVAGDGIEVVPTVVGVTTTYTVSSTAPIKFVKEFTGVVFDNQTLTILGNELKACGLLTDACGVITTKPSDFTFNVMYLLSGVWIGLTNETGVTVEANDTSGNISVILDVSPISPGVTVRVTIIG
jgi:intracellular sulfur oxidation DsrE/DsrF family protein